MPASTGKTCATGSGTKDVKTTRIYAGHILARTRATAQHLEGRIGWADMASQGGYYAHGLVAANPNLPSRNW